MKRALGYSSAFADGREDVHKSWGPTVCLALPHVLCIFSLRCLSNQDLRMGLSIEIESL